MGHDQKLGNWDIWVEISEWVSQKGERIFVFFVNTQQIFIIVVTISLETFGKLLKQVCPSR